METIISSVITGTFATVVCVITQIASNSKTRALIEYRLLELEKKQDRLDNELIERAYKLEETAALHEEKIKVANHRIEDLEKRAKKEDL